MKKSIGALALLLCVGIGWAGTKLVLGHEDPSTNVTVRPSSFQFGAGVDQAMLQAAELMRQLQLHNWDRSEVDPRLFTLADEVNAEDRIEGSVSFSAARAAPYSDTVAFYARTFARSNRHHDPTAIETKGSNPSGFFIVGWKSGNVTQVPVENVRILPFPEYGKGAGLYVFPGMPCYDELLRPFN